MTCSTTLVECNGSVTPGHVVGSTRVGIPYALRVEGTFTPVGGEPQPFLDEFARPAPSNQRLDHCTWHDEVSLETRLACRRWPGLDLVHAVALTSTVGGGRAERSLGRRSTPHRRDGPSPQCTWIQASW